MIGGKGEAISRDVQPGCRTGAPLWPPTFQAAIEFLDGAASQRVPATSCQVASAPETTAGNALPVSEAAVGELTATRCMRPSAVAAAIIVSLLYSKSTGDETNGWLPEW